MTEPACKKGGVEERRKKYFKQFMLTLGFPDNARGFRWEDLMSLHCQMNVIS